MQNIYTYVDFRECMKEWFLEVKASNKAYSYRSMAAALQVNSGSLSRILKGERTLPITLQERVVKLLKLNAQEAEYFTLLIQFDSESDSTIRRELYRQIVSMRTKRKREVAPHQFDYFNNWYNTAIRELLHINGTLNADEIRRHLQPTPPLRDIKKSLELLIELGLVVEHENGYIVTETLLTTEETWKETAIQAYQTQMMQLGIDALDNIPWKERDISTLSFSISEQDLPKASEILKVAREELLQLEEQTNKHDRVYQCNLQLFPLTKRLDQ